MILSVSGTDYFRWQPCGYWNPAECTCAADVATCVGGYTMSSDGKACYILRYLGNFHFFRLLFLRGWHSQFSIMLKEVFSFICTYGSRKLIHSESISFQRYLHFHLFPGTVRPTTSMRKIFVWQTVKCFA